MSSCLSCSDPIPACACSKGQTCVQTARSCNACAKNVCVDDRSSSKSGGGGSSTGATAGGAVGGVLGVAAILAALYFFWWKPKGLAASRRRYSKHLSHRQSRIDEKRKTQLQGAGAGGGGADNAVSKRSSVHLHLGEAGAEGTVNRRNTSPGGRVDPATGALTSRTSEEDNPFGDQNRSSIGTFNDAGSIHTSEFSFRSSHSTNVIPIAYIPPHSSSISIADGQRGAYGEMDSPSAAQSRSSAVRASIPTSMASRDSLALAGAEIIELNPLPPVLTPDTPAVPHGATANGAPIRPPRSPDLDLQLPQAIPGTSPVSSPSPLRQSTTRPTSGFPFTAATTTGGTPAFLTPPSSVGGRGMSVLAEPRASPSHLSTVTSRSGNSTMSYILDPPQIITPLNSGGVRRVEIMQGQAAVVKMGTSGPSTPATVETLHSPITSPSSTSSANPFDDAAAAKRNSRRESQDTVTGGSGFESRPLSAATDTSRWTASSLGSEGSHAVQFLQGQTVTFTNPNTPSPLTPNARLADTTSIASAFDVPQSARSSEAFESGTQIRSLTGGGGAPSMSRSSTASGTSEGSHMSLLEGIPFMAPPEPGAGTSSVSLGLPVNVTGNLDGTPASISAPTFPAPPARTPPPGETAVTPLQPAPPAPSAPSPFDDPAGAADDDDDPLPAPFLPFAGQRPTSSGSALPSSPSKDRVQSQAISVRSGFGSGLSQIPFQLGFPSGFGEDGEGDGASDRGSMISTGTRDSRFPPSFAEDEESRRDSFASDLGAVVVQEAVRTPVGGSPLAQKVAVASPTPAPSAPPLSASTATASPTPAPSVPPPASAPPAEQDETANPFADPRASVDSFALAAALSANLDAEADSK
ncbi:hypothetical protein JCM10213_001128 [Rhodosporidiobolus nylandii]